MMLNSKFIGNKIATVRKKMNLSQAELAQQVSISSQAVGKWERGESMPDISTLNRLAEILGVDLNYFSEKFITAKSEIETNDIATTHVAQATNAIKGRSWDMSKLNLVDTDFSGLKNLHEKFNSSNMQRCLFVNSSICGIHIKSNNIDSCNFSNSDISKSQIQNSNLANNTFTNCLFRETVFEKSYMEGCNFSDANFTNAVFKNGGFGKNTITNAVFNSTIFNAMHIDSVIFEGTLENCFLENCTFYNVKFENATVINTFFKNNNKFKKVQFTNCKVDNITYAFLKSNGANLESVSLLAAKI